MTETIHSEKPDGLWLYAIGWEPRPAPISSSATSRASATCSASSAPSATAGAAYSVAKLIAKHGRRGNMMKWREMQRRLPEAGCNRPSYRCDLVCPDLPKVI